MTQFKRKAQKPPTSRQSLNLWLFVGAVIFAIAAALPALFHLPVAIATMAPAIMGLVAAAVISSKLARRPATMERRIEEVRTVAPERVIEEVRPVAPPRSVEEVPVVVPETEQSIQRDLEAQAQTALCNRLIASDPMLQFTID